MDDYPQVLARARFAIEHDRTGWRSYDLLEREFGPAMTRLAWKHALDEKTLFCVVDARDGIIATGSYAAMEDVLDTLAGNYAIYPFQHAMACEACRGQ